MIYKRNEVFTRVKEDLTNYDNNVNVSSEFVNVPKTMPHVSIEMSDSYTPEEFETNSSEEEYTVMTFSVNVYSNKSVGKMEECYRLLGVIDNAFRKMNFRRLSLVPVPNLENASLGRLTATYQAMADKNGFYRT